MSGDSDRVTQMKTVQEEGLALFAKNKDYDTLPLMELLALLFSKIKLIVSFYHQKWRFLC